MHSIRFENKCTTDTAGLGVFPEAFNLTPDSFVLLFKTLSTLIPFAGIGRGLFAPFSLIRCRNPVGHLLRYPSSFVRCISRLLRVWAARFAYPEGRTFGHLVVWLVLIGVKVGFGFWARAGG